MPSKDGDGAGSVSTTASPQALMRRDEMALAKSICWLFPVLALFIGVIWIGLHIPFDAHTVTQVTVTLVCLCLIIGFTASGQEKAWKMMAIKYPYQDFKEHIELMREWATVGSPRYVTVELAADGLSVKHTQSFGVYSSGPSDFSIPWSALAKVEVGGDKVCLTTKDNRSILMLSRIFDKDTIPLLPAGLLSANDLAALSRQCSIQIIN